jgi:hypothetical protein
MSTINECKKGCSWDEEMTLKAKNGTVKTPKKFKN